MLIKYPLQRYVFHFQLREGILPGTLAGHKVNYLDSGYSEEDNDQQITSCLMKTSSGSIYIPPSKLLTSSYLFAVLGSGPWSSG